MSKPPADPQKRFWALVQKTDTCWNWQGGDNGLYGTFKPGGRASKTVLAHKYAYELLVGPRPAGLVFDHKCHNQRCVRPGPAHVRLVTQKQNQENRAGPTVRSKSGIRGVTWHKASSRWRADVGHNGRTYFAGYYESVEDAAAAVVAKRLELHTHNERDRDG